MEFVHKFGEIIDMEKCIVNGWLIGCVPKTISYVILALITLVYEIIWAYIYGISLAIVVIIACATIITHRRKLNLLNAQTNPQHQNQHLETNILLHTGNRPFIQSNFSRTSEYWRNTSNNSPNNVSFNHRVEQIENSNEQGRNDHDQEPERTTTTSTPEVIEIETEAEPITPNIRGRRKSMSNQKERGEREWSRANGERLVRTNPSTPEYQSNHEHVCDESARLEEQTRFMKELVKKQQSKTSVISYPPPQKFKRGMDVKAWIEEVELYAELSNGGDRKKLINWAYLDSDTRTLLKPINF